jgi:Co/Zn/Cd efflux system component
MGLTSSEVDQSLRRAVARVALLNLAYFGVEFSVALAIGSVSLFADSIDFLDQFPDPHRPGLGRS